MDAEEFVQLWHASFGPETQPPESCSNLGKRLTAQDVGTELRACETRVETLGTQLKRELRALDWLRELVADIERRASRGGDTSHRQPREDSSPASRPRTARDGPTEDPKCCRQATSAPTSPPRARPDVVYSTSVEVPVKSKEGRVLRCRSAGTQRQRYASDGKRHQRPGGEEERIKERAQSQANGGADKCVARAVRKRLIEQGKWWSSNLLTLEVSPQAQTPPINRPRSVSDPPLHLRRGQQRRSTVIPSIKVHAVIESFEKLGQETAPKVNTAVAPEKESSHVPHHTSSEAVNEGEKPSTTSRRAEVQASRASPPAEVSKQPVNLPVRRTQSESEDDRFLFPGCKNHVVYSTFSLNRRHVRLRLAQLEEEGPTSSTLKRRQSSIEAKLADRRRSGGWKVVEVSGQRRPLSKSPSPQHLSSVSRTASDDRVSWNNQENEGRTEPTAAPHREKRVESEVATSKSAKVAAAHPSNMFKAAKEKLSRVTSSPPLRRRPSRGSRGREGSSQHRSSNGQVDPVSTTAMSTSPVPPAGVQEVMVEKRVERSESLLSEIMSHRFSNGMEGSQLLESGDHSLVGSQEGGGSTTKVPPSTENPQQKVTLRRRPERDNDPLPEAKRRSSCFDDDDCSTPKEDFSLSLTADENMTQGLSKSAVDAASVKRSQVQRMASDSTLKQDSLEATLTPGSIDSSSPTGQGNVNYRMSYMTAVHESPQILLTPGSIKDNNQVDYLPLIDEGEGEMAAGRLQLVCSEPNLLDLDRDRMLEDSMELDEATISAVTLFGSRSGSVTSLPETLNDSQSTSTTSLTEPFLSPTHTPAPVVNLRQSGGNAGARRRNRRREGNAELDDQTGASLVEMLSSERLRSPNTTVSSLQYSTGGSLSPMAEEVRIDMSGSPTAPSLFPPPLHGTHLKEMEVRSSVCVCVCVCVCMVLMYRFAYIQCGLVHSCGHYVYAS